MTTKDPLDTTLDGPNAGTDVPVGPGERLPEGEGRRRPGRFSDEPAPATPGPNPGSNPDNPGDDPGVATPRRQPDVIGNGPASGRG